MGGKPNKQKEQEYESYESATSPEAMRKIMQLESEKVKARIEKTTKKDVIHNLMHALNNLSKKSYIAITENSPDDKIKFKNLTPEQVDNLYNEFFNFKLKMHITNLIGSEDCVNFYEKDIKTEERQESFKQLQKDANLLGYLNRFTYFVILQCVSDFLNAKNSRDFQSLMKELGTLQRIYYEVAKSDNLSEHRKFASQLETSLLKVAKLF